MAKVYLHIGAPKTATSTLQSVLAASYGKLLAQGVLYPRLLRHGDAHHTLVCDLIEQYQGHSMADLWYGERTRGEAWQDLQREIQAQGQPVDTIILSSELFFGQTRNLQEMLADIRDRLSGHELKVVVYLRRQDQLYSSFFNQDIKGVRQWEFSAYQFYQTHQIFQYDYDEMLAVWSEAVGRENILIRPYEPGQWAGGDIVRDFCATTGIAPLHGGRTSHNESLGATQLYVKQCLNRVGFDKGDNEAVLSLLLKLHPEEPLKQCSYIHRGLYRDYRNNWLQVNQRLASRYLDDTPLFLDPIPAPEKVSIYRTDPREVLQFLLAMFAHFSRRPEDRHCSLFARAAMLMLAEQDLWESFGLDNRCPTLLQWI